MGDTVEATLSTVPPSLRAGEHESEAKGAARGSFEERSKRMGWATDIVTSEEFAKAVAGRLERIEAEAAHAGAGRGAEERSPPPKKGPRVPRLHPGGGAGACAAAAELVVPEVAGGGYEPDEEMRASEFDEDEHGDDGGSNEEYERDRYKDGDQ